MGDNHQVHSKPICCLVNGLILLECHVQSDGLASPPVSAIQAGTSRGGRRERRPRLDPLNEGIKAGIERWAPPSLSLCSRVSQNKRILLSDGSRMEVVRPRGTDGAGDCYWETPALCNTSTCLVSLGHLGLLLIRYIITHNYIAYDML